MRLPSSDDSENSSVAELAIDDESRHSSDTEADDGAQSEAWSDGDASSSSDAGDDSATAEAWPPPPPGPGGERPLFAPAEEKDMISWLGQCDALGLVVTKEHFTEEVFRIVQMEQRSSCTLEELQNWVTAFSTRLTAQLGRATTFTSLLPAAGAQARRSAPAPGPWYVSVRAAIAARYPDDTFTNSESVFYLGETNLQLDPLTAVVCAVQEGCSSGAQPVANVARLAAVAASGEQVPAMWVTPSNGLVRHNTLPEVTRCLLQSTSNGQVTSSVLMTYLLKVFEPYLQSHLVPRPVLLYVNGLDSHCSMAVSQFCDDERILLVGLPPGGQARNPLQSAVGSLLSANFDRLAAEARLGRRKAEGKGMTASLSNIIAGFSQATRRCCKETIRQAFIASSLFPWTEDVIAACEKLEPRAHLKSITIGSAAKKAGSTGADKSPAPPTTPNARNQFKRARIVPANKSSIESKTITVSASESSIESKANAVTGEPSKAAEANVQSGGPSRRPSSNLQCTEMTKNAGANAASAAAHKSGIIPALRMGKCAPSARLSSPSPGEKAAKRPVVTVRNKDGTVSVAPVSVDTTGRPRAASVGRARPSFLAQGAAARPVPGTTPSKLMQIVEQRTVTLMNEAGAPVKKAIISVSKNIDNAGAPPSKVLLSGSANVPQVRLIGATLVPKTSLAPAETPAHWTDVFTKAAERNGQASVGSRQQPAPPVAPSRAGIIHGQCEEGEVTIKMEALSPPPAGADRDLAEWAAGEPDVDSDGSAPGPVVLPQARLMEYLHALDTAEAALHRRPHSAALILELKGKLHALHSASARLSSPPPPPAPPPPPPPPHPPSPPPASTAAPAANGTAAAAPREGVAPGKPPRGTRCAVRGCGRRTWSLSGEPRMYPFPTSSFGIQRWLDACRLLPDARTKTLYVCDLHFMPTDFVVPSSSAGGVGIRSRVNRRLLPDAVPHRLLTKRVPPPLPLKTSTQASVPATAGPSHPQNAQLAERHLRSAADDADARRGRGIKRPRRFDDFHWEDPFTGKTDPARPSASSVHGGAGGDGAAERPHDSSSVGMEELANKQPSALKSIIKILREENRELRDRVELVERRGAALAKGMAGLMEEYERGEAG